ncbi:hypothetical protein KKE03_05190 [Patescibacteria group bacterium]|nr:hypothetical protein [Patescibacteria group bacterium]
MRRYRSRRSIKRLGRKSKRNFIVTLIIIGILAYVTINWLLPNFIGGIGFITDIINPPRQKTVQNPLSETLAPPVLNIPYEATNSAQIDIKGYGTPGSRVRLYLDDNPQQTVDVSTDGSFIMEAFLSIGTNNIYGKTLGENNQESLPSKTIKLYYISDKPSLIINEPEDNKKIQGGDKKVRVSGKTDPGVKIFVNSGQAIVDKDGNFSLDQPLDEGDNIISIQARDQASNITEIQRLVNYTPQETQ